MQQSPSYPGLPSRYHTFGFRLDLPEALYQPEYREVQPDKVTVFRWQPQQA
ncbi:MAG TPA: hypothetical protein V6D18_21450 [Thermosynechococcaceae cyanobacterium]